MNNKYCVIMAGGIGSRFWPLSRTSFPKQFIDIFGTGHSLLQQTFKRLTQICPPENIMIVTHENYNQLIKEQIPDIPQENILLEPFRRNTAPCIAYASYKIYQKNPDAQIVVAPSDHLILFEDVFCKVINEGLDFVGKNNSLLTLGIKPSRPETGYGYIQLDNTTEEATDNSSITPVKTFTEKPNLELAKVFQQSGEFLWNSGIFLWSAKTILESFKNHLPEIDSLFSSVANSMNTDKENEAVSEIYSQCKSISIDYGIMEKESNVFVYAADFGWSDLGTWGSLFQHSEKDEKNNGIAGDKTLLYDTSNCIVNISKDKTAVIQGLDDFIIVDTDDTLLICRKQEEQRIKDFVNDLKVKYNLEF